MSLSILFVSWWMIHKLCIENACAYCIAAKALLIWLIYWRVLQFLSEEQYLKGIKIYVEIIKSFLSFAGGDQNIPADLESRAELFKAFEVYAPKTNNMLSLWSFNCV